MNRRTKKKLKQKIQSLERQLLILQTSEYFNNLHRLQGKTFIVKAVVPIRECLYPEQAYPLLRNTLLRLLEDNIDDFIEIYRDDFTENHVAEFKFIPLHRKENK